MGQITRLAMESELAERVGGLMTFVGKSASPTGSNPSFGSAIGYAVHLEEIPVATPGLIADSDLSPVDPDLYYPLCDLAEYRLILSCLGNFVMTNEQAQDRVQQWAVLRAQFQARADTLAAQYAAIINPRLAPTMAGPSCVRPPEPYRRELGVDGRFGHVDFEGYIG